MWKKTRNTLILRPLDIPCFLFFSVANIFFSPGVDTTVLERCTRTLRIPTFGPGAFSGLFSSGGEQKHFMFSTIYCGLANRPFLSLVAWKWIEVKFKACAKMLGESVLCFFRQHNTRQYIQRFFSEFEAPIFLPRGIQVRVDWPCVQRQPGWDLRIRSTWAPPWLFSCRAVDSKVIWNSFAWGSSFLLFESIFIFHGQVDALRYFKFKQQSSTCNL